MIESGFFNSINEDRKYNADSFNEFFNGIFSDDGVYKKSGDALAVVPNSGMTISVSTGRARVQQHWVNISSFENLVIPDADMVLNRYDAIVLRYNKDERNITLQIIQGEAASTPSKPAIIRTIGIHDICLAYVLVKAGATAITAADIEDSRDDLAVCGYVKFQIDSINAGIKEYRNTVTTTSEVSQITIGIPEYDSANDLLFANINGVMFVQGDDYSVSGTGSTAKIILKNSVTTNNLIEFRVIKSVIEVL